MRAAIAIVVVLVVGIACAVIALGVQWAMQASGWNCFMREQGYAQGFGEPPEQSKYCEGRK